MDDSLDPWVRDEFDTLDLGHGARNKRARRMLDGMVRHPAGTIAHTFAGAAEREGAYRFVESRAFSWTQLGDAAQEACARRCSRFPEVLVVLDGSSFRHTDNAHDDGVGPIGSHLNGGRGLKVMAAVAMTFAGVPLGLAAHHLWARGELPVGDHARRPLDDKESRHWSALQYRFEGALARVGAGCRVSYVMDAEADAFHVLVRALLLHRQECRGKHAEGSTPTLGELVTLIAQLGGYTGKSSGGAARHQDLQPRHGEGAGRRDDPARPTRTSTCAYLVRWI